MTFSPPVLVIWSYGSRLRRIEDQLAVDGGFSEVTGVVRADPYVARDLRVGTAEGHIPVRESKDGEPGGPTEHEARAWSAGGTPGERRGGRPASPRASCSRC